MRPLQAMRLQLPSTPMSRFSAAKVAVAPSRNVAGIAGISRSLMPTAVLAVPAVRRMRRRSLWVDMIAATAVTAAVACPTAAAAEAVSWRDDGSSAIQSRGSEFQVGAKKSQSPVNALYPVALHSGSYFEVTCQELAKDGPFIGIGTEESFKAGYKCRGLFFGGPGNLANGGGGKKFAWAEPVKRGDVIGVLVQVKDSKLTMTVYQNGRCLGPAFEAAYSGSKIFPVVQAKSAGDVFRIATDLPAPNVTARQPSEGHPATGNWTLEKLFMGAELGEYPLAEKMEGRPVTATIQEQDGKFQISMRVVNILNFGATSKPDTSLAPFDGLTIIGPGVSTMMAGPETMMQTEGAVSRALPSVRKWLAQDGKLIISAPTMEMSFIRSTEEPVTTEEI
ncbi:unnamed protein product [Effrenium voratum]|nr:unnamed protein product [Effrenium voratum]